MANTVTKYKNQWDFVNSTLDSSNVQFLSGTQEKLNKYLKDSGDVLEGTAKEGTFYLTSDTHRLYIGRAVTVGSSTKYYPVPVNEGIETITFAQLENLQANQGEFYYISDKNILAVRSGDKWVQLNTDTGISGVKNTAVSNLGADGDSGYVKIQTVIDDTSGGSFGTDDKDSWQLIPGSNVTFGFVAATSTTPAKLTVNAIDTTYTLGTAANASGATISLTPNDGTASSINITAKTSTNTGVETAANDLHVTSDAAGAVKITLDEVKGNAVSARGTAGATTGDTGFNIQPIVGTNIRSDLTGLTPTKSDVLDPTIVIGAATLNGLTADELADVTGGVSNIKFRGGQANLNVYTVEQTEKVIADRIAAQLQTADALTYKGTVTSTNGTSLIFTPTATTHHNGDVYKASADFDWASAPGGKVKTGDLLIATGTENASGEITGTITWQVIPSGDEETYKAVINASEKSISINSYLSNTASGTMAKQIYAKGSDDWLTVAATAGKTATGLADNNQLTITYGHKNPGAVTVDTTATDTALKLDNVDATAKTVTFYALADGADRISTDYGHLTGYKTKQVTISQNQLSNVNSTATTVTSGLGTLKSKVNLDFIYSELNGNSVNLSSSNKQVQYTSNTLVLTGSTNTSGTNTAGIINVDLVWGAF